MDECYTYPECFMVGSKRLEPLGDKKEMIDPQDSSDTPKRQQPLGAEEQREPRRLQLKHST